MPTRSYFFPKEHSHIEKLLKSEHDQDLEAHLGKFRSLGIAPLLSEYDLANVLGIGPGLLFSILRNPGRHYRRFAIKKGDGSPRIISSPRTYLKVIQWWILDNILEPLSASDNAFGIVRGRSIVDNARFHLGSRHFLNVDIKSFFDTVSKEKVVEVFTKVGYGDQTADTLAGLCCLNGCLPQGAPTSPAIGNQVLRPLDIHLASMAEARGLKYSRYADDLTFSSRAFIPHELLEEVERAVKDVGFSLKGEKTRWLGPGARTEVTGLVVKEFVQPPLHWRKRQRAALHRLAAKGNLDEEDRRFLTGIVGYSLQFPDSTQMTSLRMSALRLLEATVG
jgi:retron-type reverse transcriptase